MVGPNGVVLAVMVDSIETLLERELDGEYSFKGPQIRFVCPCGCKAVRVLPVYKTGEQPPTQCSWEWNGQESAPTLYPSIRDIGGCHFHVHLTNGVWLFCGDSGVTVQ